MTTETSHRRPLRRRAIAALLMLLAAVAVRAQVDDNICGPRSIQFGPYDYRPEKHKSAEEYKHIRALVEDAHFTPVVEQLIRGNRGYLGGDIGYTLASLPNHHRALVAVMRYGEKMKSDTPKDLRYSVECYFFRAVRFAPDDAIVRMLYATYLDKRGRQSDAIRQLEVATELAGDNGFTHYNVGLVYLEIGRPELALVQAHRAAAAGFGGQDLKSKLQALGKWQDPQVEAAAAGAAASAPSRSTP